MRHFFQLIFAKSEIEEVIYNNSVQIYSNADIVYILINSENIIAEVEIFNVLGQKIYQNIIISSQTEIPLRTATGYYIVRLVQEGEIFVEKVFIK